MKQLLCIFLFLWTITGIGQVTFTDRLEFTTLPSNSTLTADDFLFVGADGITTKLDLAGVAARIETQISGLLTQEEVEDMIGNLLTAGTTQNIAVVYDDVNGQINFTVTDMADGLGPDGDAGEISVGGGGTTLTIDSGVITNTKLANVATSTIKGRITVGSGVVEDLSATQVRTIINVEDGATADQTAAEIKTLYESNNNTNDFTDVEKTKLAAIENGATNDQTGAEIKTLYEGELDTNAFTDAEKSKLTAIESNATADQTGAEIKSLYEAEANTNAFTDAEQSKLTGIEANAKDDQIGSEIPLVTTNFDNNLSVADTNVQLALETLDELVSGVADGSITNAKLATDAVTTDKILAGTITSTDIADGGISEVDLDIFTAPVTGKILGYTANGLDWIDSAGGGTAAATTFDNGVTGYIATNVQDALEEGQVRTITQAAFDALSQADKDAFTGVITDATGNIIDAADLGYDNTNSGITATNVQDAVDAMLAGTPLEITANVNIDSSYLNRVLYNDNGVQYDITVADSVGVDGDILYLLPLATGSIIKPIASDATFANTLMTTGDVGKELVYRKVAGQWVANPLHGTVYSAIVELYTEPNALSRTNEADATTNLGTIGVTLASIESSPSPQDGTSLIEITSTDQNSDRMEVVMSGLTNGATYIIKYWAWEGTNGDGISNSWVGFTNFVAQNYTSTPTEYTHTLTTNDTSVTLRFYNNGTGPVYVDGLSIVIQ